MREVIKSRTQATNERLGGCGFPGCQKFALCSNCVQCLEHHDMQQIVGTCGFLDPKPIDSFEVQGAKTADGVVMVIVEDDDPILRSVPRA